jgi:hypothetical protein
MKIEFQLQDFLREHGFDKHGVINTLAAEMGTTRQNVSRMYNGRAKKISLDHLGKLCTWLVDKHKVNPNRLPGALFNCQRASLWEAIRRHSDKTTIYLGEYLSVKGPKIIWRWISRRDSEVASAVVQALSSNPEGLSNTGINIKYVPLRYSPELLDVDEQVLKQDIRRTEVIYKKLRGGSDPVTAIFIGSQKVNHLLEYFVADLFDCRPFIIGSGQVGVPFYYIYRESDQKIPSCFGGTHNPAVTRNKSKPGIHYINKAGKWSIAPWVQGQQDSGIVISLKDNNDHFMALSIFGFTGRATQAIGERLDAWAENFWPPTALIKSKEIGIYICKLQYAPEKADDDQGRIELNSFDILPLSKQTIKRFV